ncbi:MAG TPA: ion channel [Pyrinomonadaceae bacterium]|jgi:hypothetical protein
MEKLLFTLAGVGLLLLIVYDVYATVLHASARFGPLGESLNRTLWRLARRVAFRFSRLGRHKILNAVGPLLLPLIIFVYVATLITAFALIYYPRMPTQFVVGDGTQGDAWSLALYFSGITLTTVGYGDIAPATTTIRFIAVFQAACGLALFSLSIAYLLSVYSALERKRAVALSLYHQAEEGADVAGYIAHHFVGGRFQGLAEAFRFASRDIQWLLESHVEHPVIHYFHPVEVYKSLPRMLFLLLESTTVLRACLDRDAYPEVLQRPEVRTLDSSARHVLDELVASLDLERRARERQETTDEEARRWTRRFRQTLARLRAEGIRTRADEAEGFEAYRSQREDWESKLRRFALYLGYDWDEITGDRNLRDADEQ